MQYCRYRSRQATIDNDTEYNVSRTLGIAIQANRIVSDDTAHLMPLHMYRHIQRHFTVTTLFFTSIKVRRFLLHLTELEIVNTQR